MASARANEKCFMTATIPAACKYSGDGFWRMKFSDLLRRGLAIVVGAMTVAEGYDKSR